MPNQAPAKNGQKQQAVRPQVFRVGTYAQETNDYDESKTMVTSDTNFPLYTLTPNDWLRGLWFLFEATTTGNDNDVDFAEDAPFSAVKKITFRDVGNREVFGPLTGYDWLTAMKFGGYHEIGDPRSDPNFSATTGTGSSGGSFTMVMYLPIEIVSRDTLGDIENKSSSSSYKVEVVLAQSSDVYDTAPDTLPTVRLRVVEDGYSQPQAADMFGRPFAQAPPAAGTTQYWQTESDVLSTGLQKYLVQGGLGYSIRNIIFKLVDSNGSRATGDSDWPDPVTLSFGKVELFQRYKKIWISKLAKDFGLTSASTDVSLGRENGVFPVWFTNDFGHKPGDELRNAYLVTKPGNVLQWQGSVGGSGSHTLYTTVNYVVPPGNDPARLRRG